MAKLLRGCAVALLHYCSSGLGDAVLQYCGRIFDPPYYCTTKVVVLGLYLYGSAKLILMGQ
jgi:hypothetical protein